MYIVHCTMYNVYIHTIHKALHTYNTYSLTYIYAYVNRLIFFAMITRNTNLNKELMIFGTYIHTSTSTLLANRPATPPRASGENFISRFHKFPDSLTKQQQMQIKL